MESYSDLIYSFIEKSIKSTQNLEIEFDLNKSKNPLYIDFNVYSKLIKYLNQLSKTQKLKIGIFNILDIAYHQKINNNINNYRLSLQSEGNHPIPFISKFKNVKNSVVFKSLSSQYLKNKYSNMSFISKPMNDINNTLDIEDYNIRLRIKEEKPIKNNIEILSESDISIRYKKRISLFLSDNIRIDITDARLLNNIQDVKKDEYIKQSYEIEIEYFIDDGKTDKSKIKSNIDLMLKKINTMLKIINLTNNLISQTEKNKVIENFCRLFNNPIDYKNFNLPYVNVVTMERKHLYSVPNKYVVSDKIDGERGLLYITNSKVYIILMDKKIIYSGIKTDQKYNDSVLDGEYVFSQKYNKFMFIVFDCLFYCHQNIRNDKLLINRVLKGNQLIDECFIDTKFKSYKYDHKANNQKELYDFYKTYILEYQKMLNDDLKAIENSKVLIRHALFLDIRGFSNNEIFKYADLLWSTYNQNLTSYAYKTDGIVFHPKTANYRNINFQETSELLLKWKPTNRNTIDFYIEFERNPMTKQIDIVYDNTNSKSNNKSIINSNVKNDDKTAGLDNDLNDTELNGKYKICKLYVSKKIGNKQEPVLFDPKINNKNGDIHIVYLPIVNGAVRDQSGNIIMDKTIIEFYYNIDGNEQNYHFNWIPIKTRYDKTIIMRLNHIKFGNSDMVAYNNWNSINYPVRDAHLKTLANDKLYNNEIERLSQSVINIDIKDIKEDQEESTQDLKLIKDINFYRLQYYNMIKTMLINTYCSNKFDDTKKSILDLGIGYGFDIYKYYDAEVKNMVCVDSDYSKFTNPINGAINRLNGAKKTLPNFPHTELINANIIKPFTVEEQEEVIQNNSTENKQLISKYLNEKYDCINLLNVLQYVMKDEESFNILCENLNKVMKENTIIILICPDSELINKELKDKENYKQSVFKNNSDILIHDIVKKYDDKQKLFKTGNMIEVFDAVENNNYIPEYLVDKDYIIPEFEKRCNLKLVESDVFENIYNNMKDYLMTSSEIDSEIKTRTYFNQKIIKFYIDTPDNVECRKILFLYRYYVFIKVK